MNNGYLGVQISNVYDALADEKLVGNVYIYFNPSDLKSADPVTYDDNGNVIPFEERFNDRNEDIRYSIRGIVGKSGQNYGEGVYLDSEKLSGLSEEERINKVIKIVKQSAGIPLQAFDQNGNAVKFVLAPNTKFERATGKKIPANYDLTHYVQDKTKQEAIMLIDELALTAKPSGTSPANKSHGWVDDYGKNDWSYWRTYLQDKDGNIWAAILNIATTTNHERILYDIFPIDIIETAEGSLTRDATAAVYEGNNPRFTIDNTSSSLARQEENAENSKNLCVRTLPSPARFLSRKTSCSRRTLASLSVRVLLGRLLLRYGLGCVIV